MAAANAKTAPLLINYLAVARAGPEGGILAAYSRVDDASVDSTYASFLRKVCTEEEILSRLRLNLGSRFHKEIESEDKGGEPIHCHWLGEPADDKSTDSPVIVYFAVVTDNFKAEAPQSASALLVQLKDNVVAKFGDQLATVGEGGLTSEAAKLLESLVWTHGLSKIGAVNDALRKVKEQMQKNIDVAVVNADLLQQMEADAEQLEDEAKSWHLKTKEVKSVMCWKKWKTQLLLAAVIIVILIVIIAPLASSAAKSKD